MSERDDQNLGRNNNTISVVAPITAQFIESV